MNAIPSPTGTGGKFSQSIVSLQAQVNHAKSMRGPGVLTSVTTRGVMQRVNKARVKVVSGGDSKPASPTTVRWG
jgi:hypothetical protein